MRTPPTKSRTYQSPGPRRNYHSFLAGSTPVGALSPDEEEEDYDPLDFEEEEDEFGLPSIASIRRRKSRKGNGSIPSRFDSSGDIPGSFLSPAAGLDSGDISEERDLPNYPTSKQAQGKILRPQYKDILRGW